MGTCEVCGNHYDKRFEIIAAGEHHVFDSTTDAGGPSCGSRG